MCGRSRRLGMSNECDADGGESELDVRDATQRRTLVWVLAINLAQALVIGVVGVAADSTGLMGAALDNLADGLVYAVSLYAVGHSVVAKARAARLSGFFLIALAVGLLGEVLRRFAAGGEPGGLGVRTEEGRVGKRCVGTGWTWWSGEELKKKSIEV